MIDVAFGANLATDLAVLRPSGVIATYASDAVPEPKLPFWPLLAKDITVRFVLVYAIMSNSRPMATVGSPCVRRESCMRPAMPKKIPATV